MLPFGMEVWSHALVEVGCHAYANSCFDAEYATEDRNDEGPRMK